MPSGTICGLVGENGAGKSTTIRLLMGALRPDSGTASVLGTDVSSPEFREVKEDVGVVLDEAYFPESLNAVQVGKIMAATYRRWDQKLYDGYVENGGWGADYGVPIGGLMMEQYINGKLSPSSEKEAEAFQHRRIAYGSSDR